MKEFAYKKLLEAINSFFDEDSRLITHNLFIEEYRLGSFFEGNNLAFLIFDNVNAEIVSYSQNLFSVLGVSREYFLKDGIKSMIDSVSKEHLEFYSLFPKSDLAFWKATKIENRKNIKRQCIGIRAMHETKGEIRRSLQAFTLQIDAKQHPTYIVVVYQDITHLLKDNFYWFRIFSEEEPHRVVSYRSDTKELLNEDIISKREKEILRLIMDDMSADEIAKKLFISRITVNNHRQNILNKIGARDTTALISIAKMCNLV